MTDAKNFSTYRQHLRERIVDTALRAFAAHGIRAVKMDDIAQQLSISKRTLYELYANKEDLLYEGVAKYHHLYRTKAEEFVAQSDNVIEVILYEYHQRVEQFNNTTPQFYDDLAKYPRVMRMLVKDRKADRQRLRRFMQKGVEQGYFRPDMDYTMVLLLFELIGHEVMVKRLYTKFSIKQIFHNFVFTSLRGVSTPKGVELLDDLLLQADGSLQPSSVNP